MTSLTDSSAIFKYHRDMILWHGEQSCYALGWRDRQSQLCRFEALAAIADLNGCSVLDAGCGHADLFDYLWKLYPNLGFYYGVEQIPELLDEAVARYGGTEGAQFIPSNFTVGALPKADYVLASGSLNYASADADFIYKSIAKLYAACTLGFGFNLLSYIKGNGLIVAYDPAVILSYCKTLSAHVVLKDGYDAEDFTIFMYR